MGNFEDALVALCGSGQKTQSIFADDHSARGAGSVIQAGGRDVAMTGEQHRAAYMQQLSDDGYRSMINGDGDLIRMNKALKRAKKNVRYTQLQEGGHSRRRGDSVERTLRESEQVFAQHLLPGDP